MWSERDFLNPALFVPKQPTITNPPHRHYYVRIRIRGVFMYACGPCSKEYRPRNWTTERHRACTYPWGIAHKYTVNAQKDYGYGCDPYVYHKGEYANATDND